MLSEFFVDIASLLRDVMAPSVDTWSKALTNTTDLVAGRSWSGESDISPATPLTLVDFSKTSLDSSSTVK